MTAAAGAATLTVGTLADTAEQAGRRWVRLPDGTDPRWTACWTGGPPGDGAPVMRTIQECLQAVLWNGTAALAPVDQPVPPGLCVVPVSGRPVSELVVAWPKAGSSPLVRSFVRIAAAAGR